MRTLQIEAIKDYQVCELFYDYRYEKAEPEAILGRELMAQRFENTLKRVASFFFYKKQGLITPSYNALLSRWQKLWFPKGLDAYDLSLEQHESAHGNLASYSTAAAATLLQFHEDFADTTAEPVMIDEKYLVPLGDGVRLEGSIDLVLRQKDKYKVIKWSGRQKRPPAASLNMDFAALKWAFEYRNESRRRVSYGLYDLASTRPGFVPVHPSDDDVNALMFWANDIQDNDLYVPRRGFTAYCRGCAFDTQCAKWNRWPNHGDV